MVKRVVLIGLVSLLALAASAAERSDGKVHHLVRATFEQGEQQALVWVFFTDKNVDDLDAALRRLRDSYNPRAIWRRSMRRTLPDLFDEHDLPLAPEYVDAVRDRVSRLRVQSRWLNAVSVEATQEEVDSVAALPCVQSVQLVRRGEIPELMLGRGGENLLGGGFYGPAQPQLDQISVIDLHAAGFAGDGVIIGVLDTGFRRTHDAFNHTDHPLQVVAEYDFINDDPNTAPEQGDPPQQHEHGTIILGTMGGYLPGVYVGGAYDASFILCKTEDVTDEYPAEEDYYVAGLEFIEQNGGDVATSSLIYRDWYTQQDMDGMTAVTTIGVNMATANGVYCCTAAGNSGHDQDPETSNLGAPGDAFEVITVGAVNIFGEVPGFSSDGPTADGRVKPELLALGDGAWSIDPNDDGRLLEAAGTSMATPIIAGAVACLAQAAPHWTVPRLRHALFTTASVYVDTQTHDPFFVMGYGIADAAGALIAGGPADADLTGYVFDRGTRVSGNLNDLRQPDGSALRGRSTFGFSALEANIIDLHVFAESQVIDPALIDLAIRSRLNQPGGEMRLRLLNRSSSSFDQVASFATSTVFRTDEVDNVEATPYLDEEDGEVLLSIRTVVVVTFSALGFDGFYDQVRLTLD